MECMVRNLPPNHIQLALKYISMLFIICLRECHARRPTFSHVFSRAREIQRTKRLRSQTKEVIIIRGR